MKSVSASEARVILAITSSPSANGGYQISLPQIAKATSLARRTVIRAVQALIEQGVLAKQDGQGANRYHFLVVPKITKNRVWVCETEACNASQTESCNSGSADAPANNSTAIDQRVDLFGNLIDCGPERVHSSRVAKPRSVSAPVIERNNLEGSLLIARTQSRRRPGRTVQHHLTGSPQASIDYIPELES